MKVILLQDVKKLGKEGDVVNVADGHARNYLIPKNLAVEATEDKIEELERQKAKEAERRAQEEQEARELAEKLKNIKVTMPVKVGDAGKLFGAVNNKDIAAALKEEHGIDIDKKKIVVDDPIKSLGNYTITVKLHPNVHAKLDVQIVEK